MLAHRIPSAFVCVRCQFRLAQARFPSTPRLPHANFSSVHRRNDEASEILPPKPRPQISARPLRRLKRRKGKTVLSETTAPLEVKTLGEDSGILVLRELSVPTTERDPELAPELAPSDPVGSSILHYLQENGRRISDKEMFWHLDQLRPQTHNDPDDPHYISQAEFLSLSKTLDASFTVDQLAKYYSKALGVKLPTKRNFNHGGAMMQKILASVRSDVTKSRPFESTQWFPGTTPLDKRLPVFSTKEYKARAGRKRMVVDRILRTVWNVEMLEEIEAPGEIELMMLPWQIALLTAGGQYANQKPLQQLLTISREPKHPRFHMYRAKNQDRDCLAQEYHSHYCRQE
jgi:hypothetical protein